MSTEVSFFAEAGPYIDLAVRIGPLPDSAKIAVPVGSVRWIVCASPDYLAAHGEPKSPAELAKRGGGQSVPVHSRLSVNTAEAALDAAAQGVGLTRILSYQAARLLSQGALKTVLHTFEPKAVPVNLLLLPQRALPLKTRSFIDFAALRLKARLASN